MAVNEKRLSVTEFDFDDVKDNLKVFLKNQTEFKDYDFEGSGMNIMLDILAYNTHYLGFNANMLANEMFLDSASLRSSVVSHAKTLGYEVQSARSPIATVNVCISLFELFFPKNKSKSVYCLVFLAVLFSCASYTAIYRLLSLYYLSCRT